MNIFVCIKQVPDTEAQVTLPSPQTFSLGGSKKIPNPYDEFAIEEALSAKQKFFPTARVIAITLGAEGASEALRPALAMGCDDAIHITHAEHAGWLSSHTVGKALAKAMTEPLLIFCGRQAIDIDDFMVPYVIAETLHMPCINVVRTMHYTPSDNTIEAVRESDGGTREHYRCQLPAVIGVTTGINKPRYPTLPGIMQAKKKSIQTMTLASQLSETEIQWVVPQSYQLPKPRSTCHMISGDADAQATELIRIIHERLHLI